MCHYKPDGITLKPDAVHPASQGRAPSPPLGSPEPGVLGREPQSIVRARTTVVIACQTVANTGQPMPRDAHILPLSLAPTSYSQLLRMPCTGTHTAPVMTPHSPWRSILGHAHHHRNASSIRFVVTHTLLCVMLVLTFVSLFHKLVLCSLLLRWWDQCEAGRLRSR
ncbi:uncharacterized protein C8Q71DRAFT_550375 [Rhodofomes roseus]|uniref:Uncharacterized protein n=1 Tax=Rhodofomes roseus TaxID=34475 RepID=A0ABQ8KIF5_9APHY|nr:uncharacterized protein C8Q71DRAFT_550375 [Rhodofomes roseus]KAH9837582.1 hypothetical protein C8Q71DRAFT_550375 [Rhodofomes roseus]